MIWLRRSEYDTLVADKAAALAEARTLREEVALLHRIIRELRPPQVVAAGLAPAALPDSTLEDIDGLTPELRDAIREFAGGDLHVARHLGKEARRRLLTIRRMPESRQANAVSELAELLREGEAYTGRIPV